MLIHFNYISANSTSLWERNYHLPVPCSKRKTNKYRIIAQGVPRTDPEERKEEHTEVAETEGFLVPHERGHCGRVSVWYYKGVSMNK